MCFSFAVEDEPWTAPAPPVLHNGVVDYYELLGVSFLPTNMLDTAKLLSFCVFDHKGQAAIHSLQTTQSDLQPFWPDPGRMFHLLYLQ